MTAGVLFAALVFPAALTLAWLLCAAWDRRRTRRAEAEASEYLRTIARTITRSTTR